MSETIQKIRIPRLKLLSLNENGPTWHKRHKQTKMERKLLLCYLKFLQKRPSLPIKVIMMRVAPHAFDFCNLVGSMKGIQDIISDWLIPGLAPGRADGDKRITWAFEQRKGEPHEVALEISFIEE